MSRINQRAADLSFDILPSHSQKICQAGNELSDLTASIAGEARPREIHIGFWRVHQACRVVSFYRSSLGRRVQGRR